MKLTHCTNCDSLEKLLESIECTLVYLIKRKYYSLIYNVNYCEDSYKDLLRYRRIIEKRIYNSTYPCVSVKISTIIEQAKKLVIDEDCSRCAECDIEIPATVYSTTTTSTTSTSTTSTTSSTTSTTQVISNCSRYRVAGNPEAPFVRDYSLTYAGCKNGEPLTIMINSLQTIDLCCRPGTIVVDPFFTVTMINSICIP